MKNAIETLKIGHRGAMGYIAENTLESIQKALDFAVHGIEIDVHLCASGELVVFHDFNLERLSNGKGPISKYTLSELKQLKIGNKFQIPTLEEVLGLINKKCILNIELKGQHTALETCRVIEKYVKLNSWNHSHFLVSSFQKQELEDVYKTNKNIPLAILTKTIINEAIEFAQTIEAKAIHPNYFLLNSKNVTEAQEKGFKVNTWTVNDEQTIKRMKQYGVDAIISDFPDRI
ncbi:MAG TPA: glycerophosphodiester phosphodiesterase family protein [Yeosuana sp.]